MTSWASWVTSVFFIRSRAIWDDKCRWGVVLGWGRRVGLGSGRLEVARHVQSPCKGRSRERADRGPAGMFVIAAAGDERARLGTHIEVEIDAGTGIFRELEKPHGRLAGIYPFGDVGQGASSAWAFMLCPMQPRQRFPSKPHEGFPGLENLFMRPKKCNSHEQQSPSQNRKNKSYPGAPNLDVLATAPFQTTSLNS